MSDPNLNPRQDVPLDKKPGFAFDMKIVVQLLRNPFKSAQLAPDSQWLYGILGVAASAVGFVLWSMTIVTTLVAAFLNPLAAFGAPSLGFGTWIGMFFRMLFLGVLSQAVLLGAMWFFGNMLGTHKNDWKKAVTVLGGGQWIFGAGYLAAAILGAILGQIGLLIALITLLCNLIFIVVSSLELYTFASTERRSRMIAFSIGSYVIVIYMLTLMFT